MHLYEKNHYLQDKHGVTYVLNTYLESLDMGMEFMRKAIYGDETTRKVTERNGRYVPRFQALERYRPFLPQFASLYSRQYTFHPAMEFFFKEYRDHPISQMTSVNCTVTLVTGEEVTKAFDDFIAVIRSHAKKAGLKKIIADWESKPKKNLMRWNKLEQALFERHSRVVVIRLDLLYHAATFSPDEIHQTIRDQRNVHLEDMDAYWAGCDVSEPASMKGSVSFETVSSDRKRFFANMKGKPSLFRSMVGYVWRIECTPLAGYHLHVALFFNGAEVQKHALLAQAIGEYWRDVITAGRGRFHNCNMDWKEDAPGYGIGRVDSYDLVKRKNLRTKVVPYMCKFTQCVEVLPYKGCNLFGSGFSHRDNSKGRGRPRSRLANVTHQPVSTHP